MKPQLKRLKVLQIIGDLAFILLAFVAAYFMRLGAFDRPDFPFQEYMIIAAATTPITLMFMFFIRAYKLNQQIASFRHMQRIAFVALESVFVFMIFYYFTYREFFSRLILIYIALFTFVFLMAWHLVFRRLLQSLSKREVGVYRALVIGTNRPAEEVIARLLSEKSHIRPVAILDAYGSKKKVIHGVPVLGKMNLFERTIADQDVDIIIQVDNLEQSLNIINYALQNNVRYMMPPELLGVFQGHQIVEELHGMPLLKVYRHKPWWASIW